MSQFVPKFRAPEEYKNEPLQRIDSPIEDKKPTKKINTDKPFIANDQPQYDKELFAKGDGIDFYIDAARYLPENCSFTRITVHGFQSDG